MATFDPQFFQPANLPRTFGIPAGHSYWSRWSTSFSECIEAAGFEVLGGLLDKVVPALVFNENQATSANKKILSIIPRQFTHGTTRYERMLAATDFVSGMTDTYAVTLFRRLRGIDLPIG